MSEETPARAGGPRRLSRSELLDVYRSIRTIAVVGASTNPDRPAHYVPAYLHEQGYHVVPISPRGGELFGERVRASLDGLGEPIDVVQVFRPPDEGEAIARSAARAGARVIWFQPGTHSAAASATAHEAGMQVVTRLCMGVTHATLGLGPGPAHPEDAPREADPT